MSSKFLKFGILGAAIISTALTILAALTLAASIQWFTIVTVNAINLLKIFN